MIRKCAATGVLVLVLAGCASGGSPAAPGGTAPGPSAAGSAACLQALQDVYWQSQKGVDTGNMPKPKACAGIADDVYLQLAMQAMGAAPTAS